ncbi:hypothetical protein LOD99_10327 [Oopsacas minuta]|uniref:G-protein coupled receptors family 1 profile domain-containing protein n=1 Tax=Oopsacas minuta TaxID=111878 RepID=A0AAV7KIW5_9METZ|nr:hypothetical protein LOD99_10327 [Oopsacas minuta]
MSTLERVYVSDDISDSVNILKNYRHDDRRLKIFMGITLSELMIGSLHFAGDILWRLVDSYISVNCAIFYRIARLYSHVVIGNVLSVYCYTLTLLLLDILVRYHIRFYSTSNQEHKLRYQVKQVIKFSVLIVVLTLSGVGTILAHIISITIMLIMYVRLVMNTNRLFIILRMKCDDLKYMNGEDDSTTKEFIHSTKQFKRFIIWFILCGIPLILYILSGFFIYLPLSLVTEPCILEHTYLGNSTVIKSPAFNITVTIMFYLILSFLFCTLLMFVPTLIIYSLVYFCNKILFEYRYAHRYHIERSFSGRLMLEPLVN